MVGRASATVIRLVPRATEHDADREELIEVLTGLLELAKIGGMNGLVFGGEFRGREFLCDAAGSMHRNPMIAIAIAVSNLIAAEMLHKVGYKPGDAIF